MAPRLLSALLGVVATLATAATLALEIILATTTWSSESPLRIAAVVAASLEIIVLLILVVFLSHDRTSTHHHLGKRDNVWFAITLIASVLATAASVIVLVSMAKATDLPDTIIGASATNYLVGASVALGCAFAGQLLFVVIYFVMGRWSRTAQAFSLHTEEEGRISAQSRVKAIPYTETVSGELKPMEQQSVDHTSPPGSSSGRSAAETMSSIRTSLSHKVRPSSSKTRLLSTSSRNRQRPSSLDSEALPESSSTVVEDSFDSWDTSAVDGQTRLTVLDISAPSPGRFLETIPASPATSRSPSPGCPLDLEPPKRRRRSRSYSPAPRTKPERPSLTTHASSSELHIHPLFRSDSPTPPPAATPGTIVVAAPDAGKTISERAITRMRSGSLPSAPSPLSRQGSYDSFRKKSPSPNASSPLQEKPQEETEERQMTPPIPEWILSAGSRSSLTEYHTRKLRDRDGSPEVK